LNYTTMSKKKKNNKDNFSSVKANKAEIEAKKKAEEEAKAKENDENNDEDENEDESRNEQTEEENNNYESEGDEAEEEAKEKIPKWRVPVVVIQQRWSFQKWKKLLLSQKVFKAYKNCVKKISMKEFNKKDDKSKVMKK